MTPPADPLEKLAEHAAKDISSLRGFHIAEAPQIILGLLHQVRAEALEEAARVLMKDSQDSGDYPHVKAEEIRTLKENKNG